MTTATSAGSQTQPAWRRPCGAHDRSPRTEQQMQPDSSSTTSSSNLLDQQVIQRHGAEFVHEHHRPGRSAHADR